MNLRCGLTHPRRGRKTRGLNMLNVQHILQTGGDLLFDFGLHLAPYLVSLLLHTRPTKSEASLRWQPRHSVRAISTLLLGHVSRRFGSAVRQRSEQSCHITSSPISTCAGRLQPTPQAKHKIQARQLQAKQNTPSMVMYLAICSRHEASWIPFTSLVPTNSNNPIPWA